MDKRIYGVEGVLLIECVNPRYKKYRVRWDIQPYEDNMITFLETEFTHKPTMSEIKDTILSWINSKTNERILSGFYWKDMLIWLSTENQLNYKVAYDLATQTEGVNLPVTFKFGNTENPVYYTFTSMDELTDFYVKATIHINEQLSIGWKEKDAIDWSEYEKLLSDN